MRKIYLVFVAFIVMQMVCTAQTTYSISQENWGTMLEKVFKCAPCWSINGPDYDGYDMNAIGGEGACSYSGYCRIGKDDEHTILIYHSIDHSNFPGMTFYVGESLTCHDPTGTGRCYSSDGKLLYEGSFDDNNFKPLGKYPMASSSNKKFQAIWDGNNMYLGETVNGIKHGWGLYIWSNGDCLFGEWYNGRKSGYGMKKFNSNCTIISSKNWNGENWMPGNME